MTPTLNVLWVYLAATPLLWLTLTVLAYLAAAWLYRRSALNPILNPVLLSVTFIIGVLVATNTPYPTYFDGAKFVHFLIGPATVALAIPLYAQLERLRRIWRPIMLSVLVGCMTAIASTIAISWATGASHETMMSLTPKSATLPIAVGVGDKIGGVPSLVAVAVMITGVSGAMMVRGLLNALKVRDYAVRGFALGLSAHAIGTSRAIQVDETAGAFSALGMSLNGIVTAFLAPLVAPLLARLIGA